MVVNRNHIKRKRKDDPCFGLLDDSPKRTKVHAQRKFAQGSNVSSPVITPVKEIERQERNKDVLPEPIELLPMKRPNTEDFLTFLCFRGTPILPQNLNFFNTVSTMDCRYRSESRSIHQKNGPILTTPVSKSPNEKPFVAFGVRKRADPIVISKQMDRKRRHALALQALRRKYQEQKMAKIRAVTISKLSEKVTSKTVVRTRSVTKNEITKRPVTHKADIKVIATKQIRRKALVKQPIKSKMCLRSFRGRYIHKELNNRTHRKKRKSVKVPPVEKIQTGENLESEFSSGDDEPLIKTRSGKKIQAKLVKKQKKTSETSRLTRSHNKLVNKLQTKCKLTLKRTRVVTRLSTSTNCLRKKNKMVQSSVIRNLRRTVSSVGRKVNQKVVEVLRTTRQQVRGKMEKSCDTNTEVKTRKVDKENRREEEPEEETNKNKIKEKLADQRDEKVKKVEKTKFESKVTKAVKKNLSISLRNSTQIETIKKEKSPEKESPEKTKENDTIPSNKRKVGVKKSAEKVDSAQRPSRKTKEAAAIYMELLGHKLVNANTIDDDDDESIDSFPELPNVRRTEQRENELKAKAKSKVSDRKDRSIPVQEKQENDEEMRNEEKENVEVNEKKEILTEKKSIDKANLKCAVVMVKNDFMDCKNQADNVKVPLKLNRQRSLVEKDIDDAMAIMFSTNNIETYPDLDKDDSNTACNEPKPSTITKPTEQNFSDSDEEPLSNLTKLKDKPTEVVTAEKKDEKPKSTIKKKPHSYLPFSSSDDEDKYFHGFVKTELKTTKDENIMQCPQHALLTDLSCKDVSRRYGKGKVNMSNEQIEKWLNDSALAGMSIKKEEEEAMSVDVEMAMKKSETKLDNSAEETCSLNSSTPDKCVATASTATVVTKTTPTERKTIFRKEKTTMQVKNVNAFSASNECSVYAFEADNEDSNVSTPFRRPSRRPSSTATSKSEDERTMDDLSKPPAKFRLPSMVRTDFKPTPTIKHHQDDGNVANSDNQTDVTKSEISNIENTETPHKPPFLASRARIGKVLKTSSTRSTPMCPPSNVVQKNKNEKSNLSSTHVEFDDAKYKVPSSPSASSSSSARLTPVGCAAKRPQAKTRARMSEVCTTPINVADFPAVSQSTANIVEAPSFRPTEREFQDPLEYIEKIRCKAEKFGICRIIPPANFKPECKVSDDMRFTAYNQYVHKMLHRWGPNFKELMVIRKYLETQNITLTHPPWIGGMEIDLPRLYQTVQSLGGLKEVIEKKKWPKVSEAMKIPKSAQDRVTKLDDIYCKYLLPYDTLSPAEREKLFDEVETDWAKRESKTLLKMQRLNKLDTSSVTDPDSDSDNESEECIVKGRNIALNAFYRIARNTMSMWFRTNEPSPEEVEQEFWRHVTVKNNHICVHSGSIDSGNWGYGFAVSKNSPFARHAWNLKVLTNNSGSVLRSIGPVMGVTVPTLHVGMVFSACCWYRDPHRLPWIEYLHTGAHKIWYGIPDSMSERFHESMRKLAPNYCRNKSIWLPSDTVMVPPKLLVENGVSLCRTVQEPGQFVVVFPKAFTSSVSTGYVVSESVYFAPSHWLASASNVFDELRNNCEPSMFSVDRLLLSITSDARSSADVLRQVMPFVKRICDRERRLRGKLRELGLKSTEKLPPPEVPAIRKRKKQHDNGGDYECEICRTNVFVSLVTEFQEDVVYCLEHVIDYVEQKKVDVKNCKLLYTYECQELDDLLEKIKSAIETKQQKKPVGKVGSSLVK